MGRVTGDAVMMEQGEFEFKTPVNRRNQKSGYATGDKPRRNHPNAKWWFDKIKREIESVD